MSKTCSCGTDCITFKRTAQPKTKIPLFGLFGFLKVLPFIPFTDISYGRMYITPLVYSVCHFFGFHETHHLYFLCMSVSVSVLTPESTAYIHYRDTDTDKIISQSGINKVILFYSIKTDSYSVMTHRDVTTLTGFMFDFWPVRSSSQPTVWKWWWRFNQSSAVC